MLELRISMLIIIAAFVVFFIIILRKQKLNLKYCLVWLFALFNIAIFCIFPGLLDILSDFLGIGIPVNTLFLVCIAFLACICISLTIVVSRLSDRLRKLAQNIAILERETEKSNDPAEKNNEG